MSILSWNCQGLGSSLTGKNLQFLCSKFRPSLVFLMETRVKMEKIEKWRRRLNFQNKIYVELVGIGGGLAVWWNDDLQLNFIKSDKNMIYLKVLKGLEMEFGFLTLVYGPPKEQDRRKWWGRLKNLNPGNAVPWLCCGDFNDLLFDFEKEGENTRDLNSLTEFQNFMTQCDMEDLGAKGLAFTWSNKRLNEANVKERLDRAVCNTFWREKHQNAQIMVVAELVTSYAIQMGKWWISIANLVRCLQHSKQKHMHFMKQLLR
ncbi:uncharacterized protein LOC114745600 [Neltuma alba]|uniref:uncharacterized protein LOC114745600 n=1 Tax=Neltuma alba TaxID=207710 RepID=UPI0010A45C0F|nr:uncharacterized protein LOC114745600 [Prosopis alba]